MTDQTQPDELTGAFGTARRIPRANYAADNPAALDGWIITGALWHPLWSQFLLGLVTLADIDGTPEARRQRPDATHELLVVALDPDHGPYAAHTFRTGDLHILQPVNIAQQFTATDDQARRLATLCAQATVDGVLNPETADAPDRIRAAWRSSIHQTLEHQHDPHHGRLN